MLEGIKLKTALNRKANGNLNVEFALPFLRFVEKVLCCIKDR